MIRVYKAGHACFYLIDGKFFTEVTAPKSRMSTNSIMPAYKSDRYILPLYLIVPCLQEKELKRSIPPALH